MWDFRTPCYVCHDVTFYVTSDFMQSMVVESASRLSIRRPHSLFLRDSSSEFFLAFESKEEKDQWMEIMNQVIEHLVTLLCKLVYRQGMQLPSYPCKLVSLSVSQGMRLPTCIHEQCIQQPGTC